MTAAIAKIPLHRVHMAPGADRRISEVLQSGYVADGAVVREFEQGLREWSGNPHVETAGEYSAAIALALYEAGVRPGDDVLACPDACLGTNMPILNLFARPVWCDLDPRTANIDPADAERRITPRTKAILVFHWGGNLAPVDELQAVARRHGLALVEDASEAFGAELGGRRVGNLGSDFTIWSFGPVRHLTTGEGAAVAFADPTQAERFRWLKRYGIHQPTFRDAGGEIEPTSDIPEPGLNSYMNNIAAAIGVEQLAAVDETVAAHRANGAYYERELAGIDGIEQVVPLPGSVPGYWVYTLLAERRDDLHRALADAGVHSSKLHLRNDVYSCFGSGPAELPGVADFSARRLCIPSGWWVTEDDRERIVARIRAGW
jgi:dTDP-4-amino-4,6-dideoxygalactose transaminase